MWVAGRGQDYKPQFVYWKLILLTRKFAFALLVVVLNHDTSVQVRRSSSARRFASDDANGSAPLLFTHVRSR